MRTKAEIAARRKLDEARAAQRREDRRRTALRLMCDWDAGMPPLSRMGADIGTLRGLVKDGLATELPRDALGDPRFRATDAGLQAISA
jgi:hypothetical protein